MPDNDDDDDIMDTNTKRVQVRRKKKSATYIAEENNGESIVDFLDNSAAQKLRSSLPNKNQTLAAKNKKKDEFEIDSAGRLIIRDDSDEEEDTFKRPKGYELDNDSEDGEKDEDNFATMVSTAARKRKRTGTSVASSKVSQPAMKYQAGGTGIHRALHANSKKDVKQYGSEYKSTKAKGDVKRKGKPDPYAYVPLQKSALNRRKRAKFEGQFKGLVNAANTGSVKGKKAGLAGQMKKVKIK